MKIGGLDPTTLPVEEVLVLPRGELQLVFRRIAYIVVHSLRPSEIEWDTVQLDNPSTWGNWETELKNAGLSEIECSRVLGLVLEANCLDEAKLRKARELFLRGTPAVPVA